MSRSAVAAASLLPCLPARSSDAVSRRDGIGPAAADRVVVVDRIGHDPNNLLTVILVNASLIRLDLPPDALSRANFDQIEEVVRQAVELADLLAEPPLVSAVRPLDPAAEIERYGADTRGGVWVSIAAS
jgi:hypothetical protein